jgi:hypothetical protein
MSANPDEQHQRQIRARIDACQSELGNLEAEQQRLAGRYSTLKGRIDALREELQPSRCQADQFDQWSADAALGEKRGGRGSRPLLAADQWEFVVREMWAEELVPYQVSPFHDDGWQPQVMGNTFAKVQLTRQDGSDVGDLLLRHFRIGPAEYRILEVIEHDGNRAITRCQVQRASNC